MSGSSERGGDPAPRGRRREEPGPAREGICRAREVGRLDAALQQVLAGSGRLVLLSGEPGSGRTYLAEELARRARERGAAVAWGRGWGGEGAPELWPWLQVIRSCLRAVDDGALRELVGPHGGELTALLAPLRTAPVDALSAAESPAARFRLFNAITHFLEAYARRTPLLVILDDLQRADPSSLLLLQFFAQELRERRILLLATYRAPGAAPNRTLTETVLEVSREPAAERIALGELSAEEVGAIAAGLGLARLPAERAMALRDWTGGNPLLLVECLRALDAGATAALPMSTELRVLLEQRLEPLADAERALLAGAAARADELDRDALPDALASARLLGLVQPAARDGTVRFTHGLLAALLREEAGAAAAPRSPPAPPPAAAPTAAGRASTFRREGEYWTMEFDGRTCRMRDAKGLGYIALLLRHPGRQIHVSELVSLGDGAMVAAPAVPDRDSTSPRRGLGDGGAVLDAQAKAEYRRRLAELEGELAEARAFHDQGRIDRAQHEIEAIGDELSAAVGLGGRDRRLGSDVERARVNVTRSIARAVEKIADNHPGLAQHLDRCLRTGSFCTYVPDASTVAGWLT